MNARRWLCLALAAAFASAPPLAAQEQKPILTVEGKLADDDPKDKVLQTSGHKVHEVKLEAGKTYRIDMTSKEIDPFIRLENAAGKQLGLDDDGAGYPNARIIFKADEAGAYKIIATCFGQPMGQFKLTGGYNLTVNVATPADVLELRVKTLPRASAEERNEILRDFTKHLKEVGAGLAMKDVQLAMSAANALERGAPKQAAQAYKDFGIAFAASKDAKIAGIAKMFEGSARRLGLMGNTMAIKGTTLDDKAFDLASLKGKVVLVDFWATWCGPCIAEMPRMTKAYTDYKDRGFEIIGISVDADRAALDTFLERRKLPWPTLHDVRGEGKTSLSDYYGVMSIPLPILIDRDGKVVSMNARGPELERLLEKHLGPLDKQ